LVGRLDAARIWNVRRRENMAVLNITYNGMSADYPLDVQVALSDADVKRIAVEVVRAGGLRGLQVPNLPDNAFDNFVIDRFERGERIYLRPKVPFGALCVCECECECES
jgi:hypothetical protein